jgi:hypothetical protein
LLAGLLVLLLVMMAARAGYQGRKILLWLVAGRRWCLRQCSSAGSMPVPGDGNQCGAVSLSAAGVSTAEVRGYVPLLVLSAGPCDREGAGWHVVFE